MFLKPAEGGGGAIDRHALDVHSAAGVEDEAWIALAFFHNLTCNVHEPGDSLRIEVHREL